MIIDINATLVSDKCDVWRVFPGKSYRLLDSFLESNAFFLEQPNAKFDPANIAEEEYLAAKIYAADLMAKDRRDNGNRSKTNFNWRDYARYVPDADLNRKVGATIDFYTKAKKGDLIVSPDHKSRGNIFIGVIAEDFQVSKVVEDVGNYEGLTFQARPAKWITRVGDSTISPSLGRTLRHEHAFTKLDRNLYNEIYSLAYGNFIGNGVHSSVILNGNYDFRDIDNTLIGVIFKLSALACQAYDEGDDQIDVGSLFDFLIEEPPLEYTCLLSAEYHSPGFSRYVCPKATATVAVAVIAGMLHLAGAASAGEFKQQVNDIKLVNSASGKPIKCPDDLQGPAELLFQSIDGDKLRKACHNLRDAAERAKLNVKSKARD